MTRILLCRHAEPEAWARGRFCGALDVALSAPGRAQAEVLAAGFAAEPLDVVLTSPARRALDTARPIAAAHGLEPVIEPALREIDFGYIDGRSFEQVEAEHPELYSDWLRAPTRVRFPGGERFAELQARVVAALTALRIERPDAAVAVVSHGGVIRALLAAWLSVPDEAVFCIDQRYASVNIVDWLDGRAIVRLVNGPPGCRP